MGIKREQKIIILTGLSKADAQALSSIVEKDPRLKQFADKLGQMTKLKEGYTTPDDNWSKSPFDKECEYAAILLSLFISLHSKTVFSILLSNHCDNEILLSLT